jgi:hypothetical protein
VLTNGQGNWDKENRALLKLCPCTDLARSEPEAELLLLKRMPNWKRVQLLNYDLLWTWFRRLAGYFRLYVR